MHDQADQLRKLVRATVQVDATIAPGGPIIALSGGRAGVGVTTIACQLARELARLGKQVVLIDANLQRPNVTKLFNSTIQAPAPSGPDQVRQDEANPLWRTCSEPCGTLMDVLAGARRAVEVLSATADDGVRLLAGCSAASLPPLDRQALDHLIRETTALSRQVDVVLIDAGHGMNAWIDRLWQLARQVLLVSTPESAALLDSYAAVKLSQFHRLEGKLRLLLNRAIDESEALPLAERFEETCQRFLFITPKDPATLPAFSRRELAAGKGPTAAGPDEPFQRGVRLLAADLACEFRVAALRLIRPKQQAVPSMHQTPESSQAKARKRKGKKERK